MPVQLWGAGSGAVDTYSILFMNILEDPWDRYPYINPLEDQ